MKCYDRSNLSSMLQSYVEPPNVHNRSLFVGHHCATIEDNRLAHIKDSFVGILCMIPKEAHYINALVQL